MKICQCNSNECNGNVERYSIKSAGDDSTYPNRFWGIVDYCEKHLKEDQEQGFILTIANEEVTTYIL